MLLLLKISNHFHMYHANKGKKDEYLVFDQHCLCTEPIYNLRSGGHLAGVNGMRIVQ